MILLYSYLHTTGDIVLNLCHYYQLTGLAHEKNNDEDSMERKRLSPENSNDDIKYSDINENKSTKNRETHNDQMEMQRHEHVQIHANGQVHHGRCPVQVEPPDSGFDSWNQPNEDGYFKDCSNDRPYTLCPIHHTDLDNTRLKQLDNVPGCSDSDLNIANTLLHLNRLTLPGQHRRPLNVPCGDDCIKCNINNDPEIS